MSHIGQGIETIEQMVYRHEKDLYRGNGKPGVCNRIEAVEDGMELLNKRVDNTDTKFWAIILLLVANLGGIVMAVVKGHQ